MHNTRRLDDGRWRWRYDIGGGDDHGSHVAAPPDFLALWDDVDLLSMPVMLVEGALSKHVLPEHDAEFRRRKPDTRVEVVDGAGHAVQSDQPNVLIGLLHDFLD